MSRGFNEHEKQVIKHALIEQASELFRTLGFQKTSIAEITKNVGIAQGTFYTFFTSKEELYFLVLELEEEKIREQLSEIDLELEQVKQPKELFKKLLQKMIHIFETNPLMRELYIGDHFKNLWRRLPPEMVKKHYINDEEALSILFKKWKLVGINIKKKPSIVSGILRSLFVLTMHKKEIGEEVYHETLHLFIDMIADKLIEGE